MIEITTINIISFFLIFFIGFLMVHLMVLLHHLLVLKPKFNFIKFLFYYLILFFFVIIFWLYFPIISLTIFIIMTIIHFGLCDWTNFKINKHKFSVSFAYGMTIIFGIIFFNEDQSFKIFEYLTNE